MRDHRTLEAHTEGGARARVKEGGVRQQHDEETVLGEYRLVAHTSRESLAYCDSAVESADPRETKIKTHDNYF